MKFVCPICGKDYQEDLDSYLKCVNACAAKEKQAKEQIRKQKIEEELTKRKNEVKTKQTGYIESLKKFMDDYPNEAIDFEIYPGYRLFTYGSLFNLNDWIAPLDKFWSK